MLRLAKRKTLYFQNINIKIKEDRSKNNPALNNFNSRLTQVKS